MEEKQEEKPCILNDRFQNLLKSLSKCKIDSVNDKEEIMKFREINSRLEVELRETRELEKSHRYHLQSSREMIGNLQETVSQLVYLKRDVKKLKDEIAVKDATISAMEKEKESLLQKQSEIETGLRIAHEKHIEELNAINERKIQQVQHDSDTQIAQFTCVIEELRSKIQEMETENRDKMNVVVLDYEEKIQRGAAQVAQLQEQLQRQAARTDSNIDAYRRTNVLVLDYEEKIKYGAAQVAQLQEELQRQAARTDYNIDAYRRRLEELEEKLKQSQFKHYLAQSSYPQYESQVERPYSVERDFPDCSIDMDPVLEVPKQPVHQNKPLKQNTLQVTYYGNKGPPPSVQRNENFNSSKNEKKGQFNISKKRKLYSQKDLQDS